MFVILVLFVSLKKAIQSHRIIKIQSQRDIWKVRPTQGEEVKEWILDSLPSFSNTECPEITVGDIGETLRKAKGVAGPDGWLPKDVKRVPELWGDLAKIFMLMEKWRTEEITTTMYRKKQKLIITSI